MCMEKSHNMDLRNMVTVHQVVNNLGRGGAQKLVRQLHDGLIRQGFDSRLVSLAAFAASENDTYTSFGYPGDEGCYDLRSIPALHTYIRKHCRRGDIIHVHLFPAVFYASLAVRFTGWRGLLMCTEHNTYNRRRHTRLGWLIDTILYAPYQHILCISEGTEQALADWMPSLRPKLRVIRNGVSLVFDRFEPRPPCTKPVILSVGSLTKQKNYDTALRAMTLLKDMPYEYWIAGEEEEEDHLKALCHSLNLEASVKFLGYVENIPALLRDADIFLMPSRWEGFGLALVEAMNAGLPVVASDAAGIRDIVTFSEPCGILIQPDDPLSIAKAVTELLTNREKRLDFGENAFIRSASFSIDEMIENYITFYNSVFQK